MDIQGQTAEFSRPERAWVQHTQRTSPLSSVRSFGFFFFLLKLGFYSFMWFLLSHAFPACIWVRIISLEISYLLKQNLSCKMKQSMSQQKKYCADRYEVLKNYVNFKISFSLFQPLWCLSWYISLKSEVYSLLENAQIHTHTHKMAVNVHLISIYTKGIFTLVQYF